MNDFLFYFTILALLYYFFYYRPQQKKLNTTNPPLTKPLTHSQFTQTEPNPIPDHSELESQLDQLIKEIQQLCLKIN